MRLSKNPIHWFNYVLFLGITILFSSCAIKGFHSGYKKLDKAKVEKISFVNDGDPIPKSNKQIFAVTAQSFLKSIQEDDTTILYNWSPHCGSDVCIPIFMAQNICNQKGYKLFVVSDYYDDLVFANIGKSTNPLLTVNHLFYKTNYSTKYMRLFSKGLDTDKIMNKSNNYYRYLVFNKGKLVEMRNRIN